MALKIRLRQQGRNNRPFYRLVLTDVRARRDGKYVEALGWYNPFEEEQDKSLSLKTDRIQHWLGLGAELSERAEILVSKVSPALIKAKTQKEVEQRAKANAKKKARKEAAA
jgi:small subunit ribosomal protein S16